MTMEPGPQGLSALQHLLPPEKAALSLRLVGQGRLPAAADFERQGMTLSPQQAAVLGDWLQHGLCSQVVEQVRARDGTVRLGVALRDGRRVETVAMPVGAVCVSTQVGCAVGCRFCASGLYGVERNLGADEIVEQVVHARRFLPIDRVVFMGMGEPSHNLDAVLEAVAAIRRIAGIGPRRQTVSTIGSVRTFERMAAAEVRPCAALSLHTADETRRRELLPHAHRDPLPALVGAADGYGRTTGMPVQFEWTMLDGINDSLADADAVCELLQGVRGYLNCIVWNPVPGLPFAPPPRDRIVAFVRAVKQRGLLATIRDSSGPDAEAACGQLRLRHKAPC